MQMVTTIEGDIGGKRKLPCQLVNKTDFDRLSTEVNDQHLVLFY